MGHQAMQASRRSPIHRANEANEWPGRLGKPALIAFPTPVRGRWKKKSSLMTGYRVPEDTHCDQPLPGAIASPGGQRLAQHPPGQGN